VSPFPLFWFYLHFERHKQPLPRAGEITRMILEDLEHQYEGLGQRIHLVRSYL
jgi:hypothetical protein